MVLEQADTALQGACPFHEREVASPLVVDAATNTWTCATCNPGGGDLLAWVMRAEGVSRRHAATLVRADAPLTGAALRREHGGRGSGVVKTNTARRLAIELDLDDDHEALRQIAAYYHRALLDDAPALAWLEQRAIGLDAVRHFGLGLANRTLGLRLPQQNRRVGATARAQLRRLGVLRDTGHEQLSGCVVVPLVDAEGRLTQLCGRRLAEQAHDDPIKYAWLHGEPRGLIDPGERASDCLILTPSLFEVLALWSAGHRGVAWLAEGNRSLADFCSLVAKRGISRIVYVTPQTAQTERASARLSAPLEAAGASLCAVVAQADPTMLREIVASAVARPSNVAPAEPLPDHVPPPAPTEPRATNDDEFVLTFDDRRWRMRGLASNKSRGTLRVNILVARENVGFHVDVFDLSCARHRAAFARMAADELRTDEAIVRRDLGQILLALEQAQDELLRRAYEPTTKVPAMTEAERTAALELLGDPNLLDRVLDDLARLGVVGERDNLLLAYLCTISRKLAEPLAIVVQSSSAAGKSSLLAAVLALVPEEDRVVYSAMTGQSLYYMGSKDLRHKVLSIAEDRGVERASYALKLLQSDGALTIASTGKDPGSGRLVSQEYRVEGPVAIMMTTTAVDLDDELLSRCLVLAVDESPQQTRKIHEHQRAAHTMQGLLARERRSQILRVQHDAQRLLRPIRVVIPHQNELSFLDLRVRARRDHRKLLALVEAIAMLHQHQRAVKVVEDGGRSFEVVEALPSDVELAQRLLASVTPGLDELPIHTQRLVEALDVFVDDRASAMGIHRDHVRFSRRQLREHTRLGDTHLKVHLRRLVDAELVLVHGAHKHGALYSLAFDRTGNDATYDPDRSTSGRGLVDRWSGGGRQVVDDHCRQEIAAITTACVSPSQQQKRNPENRTSGDERSNAKQHVREPGDAR